MSVGGGAPEPTEQPVGSAPPRPIVGSSRPMELDIDLDASDSQNRAEKANLENNLHGMDKNLEEVQRDIAIANMQEWHDEKGIEFQY